MDNFKRISSIDATRGLVMIIMTLDHVRDFMHLTSATQNPTNLQTTTAAIFLTRWITHLCAPTFVFLSGVSAYIYYHKSTQPFRQRFLLSRGLWLVVLDLTIINFSFWFDVRFHTFIMEVISAIGVGLIVISLLLKIPSRIIGFIGFIIIFSHNLLQNVSVKDSSTLDFIFSILFRQNFFLSKTGAGFVTGYPLVPWLGIILAGFSCGELFNRPVEIRKKQFLLISGILLSLFVVLRWLNFYGDPLFWSAQKNNLFTFLSFINLTKYPPSLLFILITLSIMFVILWFTEGKSSRVIDVLRIYGKVPLFYFVIHLYIIHLTMFIMVFLQGFGLKDLQFGLLSNGRPKGSGVELGTIYLVWIAILILLFPLCKWYGKYKANHKDNLLMRYL